MTLSRLATLIRARKVSVSEVVGHFLERVHSRDPELGAFRLVDEDRALGMAAALDDALAQGATPGPLYGLPYGVKDVIDVAGLPTTAGSSLLADNIAKTDAAVIQRLSDAGMIPIGKTNTVQFAYGGAGVNHDHGTPRNPWATVPHVPGGSSSGSGVAVGAGLAPVALGTDTGGSVRIPAALCGVTGLKTTVGRVSRHGVYPLSHSLDSVGPLSRSAEDAALVYQAMHGPDPADSSTRGVERHDVLARLSSGVRGMRLGFPESVFWDDADEEVALAVRRAGQTFRELGAAVESVAFPLAERARALNPKGLVIAAEAYSVNRHWVDHHLKDLDPVVGTRLLAGRKVSAADYLETVRAWEALRLEADHALSAFDGLLCPTTPIPAAPIQEVDADLETYLRYNLAYLRNTTIGNILGLCGLSVPCGFTSAGLPIGLMIYGRAFTENRILRAGVALQSVTEWHLREPPADSGSG